MQHCGNCGMLLSEEDLRRGSCVVCQWAVTPDIDTVPADAPRNYQALLIINPDSSGKVALPSKTTTSVAGATGTAGDVTSTPVAVEAVPTTMTTTKCNQQ